ncbi:MAG TPA: small ribosomal subunit Rsm22 family protein [Bdellovibrionota bacterium]|nr:small ribosomal subunit Rsm22 family protein [Bdellovibrionota bacterium]
MRVPQALTDRFGVAYSERLTRTAVDEGLLSSVEELASRRFLARSVVPHIKTLSQLFNRRTDGEPGDRNYWRHTSGNAKNLRLAYFLGFMPPNQFRVASVWTELHRLGFRFTSFEGSFRAVELGAGPAAGATGIAAAEGIAPLRLPPQGEWSLIERDLSVMKLGERWASECFNLFDLPGWTARGHHHTIDREEGLLNRRAPRFHLWVSSFFLNEMEGSPAELAQALSESWERHLEDDGLAILVEPALQLQSRRLLEVRKALLERWSGDRRSPFKILLPCLGHQPCGALAKEGDWCHEQVDWWRPPYLRKLDEFSGLDRKNLPFSYLVVARTRRDRRELLPSLGEWPSPTTYRLVSPTHFEGRDAEFFVCGQDGKRRCRMGVPSKDAAPQRGSILLEAELHGAPESTRIQKVGSQL